MFNVVHQLVELGIEPLALRSHLPQFLNELLHGGMFFQAFFDQCWSLLRLLVYRRVEDAFLQLRVGFQLDKDFFRQGPLGFRVAGAFLLGKEVFNPLVILFQHGNGIHRGCIGKLLISKLLIGRWFIDRLILVVPT
jgi:hypothetical protein